MTDWWIVPAVLGAVILGYAIGAGIIVGLICWLDRRYTGRKVAR